MGKKIKTLSLTRETIRTIDEAELASADGGTLSYASIMISTVVLSYQTSCLKFDAQSNHWQRLYPGQPEWVNKL